jgi:transcriptional regulator with XRE-family HTH domain
MYKIENNKISPTIETLEKIAASLDIKVSEIIKEAEVL